MSVSDPVLLSEGLKALTLAQAQAIVNHNLEKIERLTTQNEHLLVCLFAL